LVFHSHRHSDCLIVILTPSSEKFSSQLHLTIMAESSSASSGKAPRWIPLEADPELMTRYLHKLGADPSNRYAFHDVLGVDDELLAMVPQPALAVLLLYPLSDAAENHRRTEDEAIEKGEKKDQADATGVYYMHQTVGNACGTVGLTHAVLNLTDKLQLTPDGFFHKFLTSTKSMNFDERAQALEQNDDISVEHEQIASAGVTDGNEAMNTNLHFIALVGVNGSLWELDGRRKSPVCHGPTSSETLLRDAVRVVKEFMARDPGEVRFNMVALAPAE